MATVILESTQTETADDKILGKDWAGEFQLFCKTFPNNATSVHLQIREPDGTWINAMFDGKEIQITTAGDVLDIRLVRDYEYRLNTDTAGAEVLIAKYDKF